MPRRHRNYDNDEDMPDLDFADPGGRSALRAGKRIYSCPTCGRPNQLTKKDKELGYQCDHCADAVEGRFGETY
jgi:DNA-directed RNA polymerase subunit RPC12/RpoP